jgi:hypothetical protein
MVGQLLNDLTNYDFVRSKCIQTYLSVVWWPYAMCTKKWHCNIEIYCWSITATIITVEKLLLKNGQNLLSENYSDKIIVGDVYPLFAHEHSVMRWEGEKSFSLYGAEFIHSIARQSPCGQIPSIYFLFFPSGSLFVFSDLPPLSPLRKSYSSRIVVQYHYVNYT